MDEDALQYRAQSDGRSADEDKSKHRRGWPELAARSIRSPDQQTSASGNQKFNASHGVL